MTSPNPGSLESDIKAKLHDAFPGPGVPIPEGVDEEELIRGVPMHARRSPTRWCSGPPDAASMVMGTLSQSGSLFPSRWAVAFWGLSTGAVAVLMLWAGGNDALNGLQTMTIIVAAPFVVVMIGMCVSLYLDVTRDPMVAHLRNKPPARRRSD